MLIAEVRRTLTAVVASARVIVRRAPQRSITAAAKGPIAPKTRRLIPRAKEIVARDQWNSSSSGTISTPGVARTPAETTTTAKVTATMTPRRNATCSEATRLPVRGRQHSPRDVSNPDPSAPQIVPLTDFGNGKSRPPRARGGRSDWLTEVLLRAYRRAKYRDRQDLNIGGKVEVCFTNFMPYTRAMNRLPNPLYGPSRI